MPSSIANAYAFLRRSKVGGGDAAVFGTLLGLLLVGSGCQIPPDIRHLPRYIYDSFTNPNFVVNAPVLHELLGVSRGVPDDETQQARFRLPAGFEMNVYAERIPLARFMKVTARGDVIVTQPRKQRVLLLTRDADGDGRADGLHVLLEGLHLPHGVELTQDQLFVAGPAYILRVGFDVEAGQLVGEPEIFASLPETLGHSARPLRLGPDGWLYTAIGADCNVCEPTTERDQTILRFDLETGREEIVASGFRNVADFDWHPETNAMFATEVGVDYAGENLPLEELNEIQTGRFYGFPYLHGPDFRDPKLAPGHEDRIAAATAPIHTFTAHSTPLGVTFLRNPELPEAYRNSALVVLKGSWNRKRKAGYKVVSLHWVATPGGMQRIEEREFITGFELDEHVIGRPVDVVEGPDGSLYVSDDMAGAIYRIRYAPNAPGGAEGQNEYALALRITPSESASDPLERLAAPERATLSERGGELFDRHACASCHADSEARAAVVPLVGLASKRSIEEIVEALRSPPASMPRVLLTDGERRALAVYLLGRE